MIYYLITSINIQTTYLNRHGLTNGASLLLYKLPNEDNVIGQHAFLNSDCIYEVNKFIIIDDKHTHEGEKNKKRLFRDSNVNLTFEHVLI